MNETSERNHTYDNLRCLLIFTVALGHLLELFLTENLSLLYRVIYSFHMPAFIFLTGMFARFHGARILKRLALPYVLFQLLYLVFHARLFGGPLTIQFTTPYWLMWYLLVIFFYDLLIPMLPPKGSKASFAVLGISVIMALIAGFMEDISAYLSLSRFFVFFPFFLWGYYHDTLRRKEPTTHGASWIPLTLGALLAITGSFYVCHTSMPYAALYCSNSYAISGTGIMERAMLMATAAGWILFLIHAIPNKKLPLISALGQNTLPIFLLHGFVIRLLSKSGIFHFSPIKNLLLACGIAALMVLLFGSIPLHGKRKTTKDPVSKIE